MSAPTSTRRPTTTQPRERISSVFWSLARGSGAETQSREPEDVVRHLIACLGALDGSRATAGSRAATEISADALSFLLQLEHDPYYASPEQTRGGDKDSQSLVYSIAVLLFERLTGHHPFVESLSPMRCALARDRSTRVGKNNLCSLPSELRAILSKAMSPFPEDRWRGEAELRAALESYLGRADTVVAWGLEPEGGPPVPPQIVADGSRPARAPRRCARGTAPPPPPGSPARPIFEARREEALVPRLDSAFPGAPQVLEPARHSLPWRRALSWRTGVAVAAAAAATGMWLLLSSGGGAGTADASSARPVATPIVSPATPAAEPSVPSAVVVVPVPAPADFDPELGGAAAAEVAPGCFGDARLRRGIQVGVSLRYAADSGLSDRVYFGSGLAAAERRCLEEALIGLASGAAPERNRTVTYSLWLSSTSAKHRVHGIE